MNWKKFSDDYLAQVQADRTFMARVFGKHPVHGAPYEEQKAVVPCAESPPEAADGQEPL